MSSCKIFTPTSTKSKTRRKNVRYISLKINALDYVKIGKEAVKNMFALEPLDQWTFKKRIKDCDLYVRKGGSNQVCFRVDAEFDFPTQLVVDYCKSAENRMKWDDAYDYLHFIREFSHETKILHARLKA